MKISLTLICCTLFVLFCPLVSQECIGQKSDEFIYGKITTKSNDTYVGFMRWGLEELAWHDVFNSVKVSDEHKKQKAEDKNKNLWKDFSWDLSSIWENKYREVSHTFACFFGDIKAIYPHSSSTLDLELKNGIHISLEGGSNDVGTTIQLYDFELGLVKIAWNKIKSIEFSQAPYLVKRPFGDLIYGTVDTYKKGAIEGYIKWDLDERTTQDVLDGYGSNGNNKIKFEDIRWIKKYKEGVILKQGTGTELFLKGTNDVNSENRGIAIYNHDIGRIEIGWNDFNSLEIHKNIRKGPSYNDFKAPKGINAVVKTYSSEELSGMIVYDIDEKWEFEFLDGDDDNIKYQIPFRNIKSIYPKNKSYSMVKLRNGDQILLGERQDVSSSNDGILIFTKTSEEPIHIQWSDVKEIDIK